MQKEHVLKEFSFKPRRGFFLGLKISLLFLAVIGFGIYVGDLLFGKNSLEVLLNLQEKKALFKQEIKKYKQENAALQKEYFELLQLEPDSNEESK